MLFILVMIVGLAWLSGPTNATAHDSSHRPMLPPGMFDNDDDIHIEVWRTNDGHWHYFKRNIHSGHPLGCFLLPVIVLVLLILFALL